MFAVRALGGLFDVAGLRSLGRLLRAVRKRAGELSDMQHDSSSKKAAGDEAADAAHDEAAADEAAHDDEVTRPAREEGRLDGY